MGTTLVMDRRQFLAASAANLLSGCDRLPWQAPPVRILMPGMAEGHLLRDAAKLPPPSGDIDCDVAILGSGVAGIAAAWRLAREGRRNILMISGPEPDGNAAGASMAGQACPTGAHYLPLPSMESRHVREMLADVGVITADAFSQLPEFDERILVHPEAERLLRAGKWYEDLLPEQASSDMERAEHQRFLRHIEHLKTATGSDGKRAFAMPIALSSQDETWRALDRLSFRDWLAREGYRSAPLHWYANYACRDDYGTDYQHTSAYAGLHYFASRAGEARNAEPGTVLTWPDGLQGLVRALRGRIAFGTRLDDEHAPRQMAGFAARVQLRNKGIEVLVVQPASGDSPLRSMRVRARHAICAMPLHVATHIVEDMRGFGFDPAMHQPQNAPWMVSNFLMRRFPEERGAAQLAWDNVAYEGKGLGYVVATHQLIRVAKPEQTVFTAYNALSDDSPQDARRWLQTASPEALLERAAGDLHLAYERLWPYVERVDITLRGHAMASPRPGYLSNKGLLALREVDGPLQFAHSDLSGYSVFEEAAWWGDVAAKRLL
ncbi:NAD(P)-binding protein [Uliginosibacterium sp. H3]|uniref:NAD(P)-binding protein n=1 Tax=Uliginosibacterium silvisoli TaxID=3114758 RepID=A0ABU6K135_9RHOO|nr:NAD(P)-binding protein [Uliginosibacterium sp. H3]